MKRNPIPVSYQEKINAFGSKKEGQLTLLTGEKIKTTKLVIGKDSLFFKNQDTFDYHYISLSEVDKIEFKDHIIGMGQGFYAGAGIGALVGLLFGAGQPNAGLATLVGIPIGAALGGISGLIVGGSYEFIFKNNQ